jgi:hypothetical protein
MLLSHSDLVRLWLLVPNRVYSISMNMGVIAGSLNQAGVKKGLCVEESGNG